MKRLDWTLVRPPQPNSKSMQLADSLELRIAARLREATHRVLTPSEVEKLAALEARLERHTVSSCIASQAPKMGDSPHWEDRVIDEYNELDLDYELDEYLEMRREEFDCERCPHAVRYSLYPQDPCELSVGPLLEALHSPLREHLLKPMGPQDMQVLATSLEVALNNADFSEIAGLDVPNLLKACVRFLRFWSDLNFGLRPELVCDQDAILTPEFDEDDSLPPSSRFN